MDLRTYLGAILEKAKADIIANIDSKGIKASGRTQNAMAVEFVSDSHARLVVKAGDVAPVPTLEVGRGSGPVPYNLQDILFEWSKAKSIGFSSERDRMRFANALKWKIAREGTQRSKQHEDVFSSVIRDLRESVEQDVRDMVINAISARIKSTKLHSV